VSRITFQKREKERKRQEKQRIKAQKRAEKKAARHALPEAALQQPDGALESQVSPDLQGENQSEAG